jgi:hypothetical protein
VCRGTRQESAPRGASRGIGSAPPARPRKGHEGGVEAAPGVLPCAAVIVVMLDRPELRAAVAALPAERRREIRVRYMPHDGGPLRMLHVTSRSWEADRLLRDLVDSFGQCIWQGRRWHIRRPQLRLFGGGA